VVVGRRRPGVMNVAGGGAQTASAAAVGAAEKRRPQLPACAGFAAPGYAVLVSGMQPADG
jgi:hypothetical protein